MKTLVLSSSILVRRIFAFINIFQQIAMSRKHLSKNIFTKQILNKISIYLHYVSNIYRTNSLFEHLIATIVHIANIGIVFYHLQLHCHYIWLAESSHNCTKSKFIRNKILNSSKAFVECLSLSPVQFKIPIFHSGRTAPKQQCFIFAPLVINWSYSIGLK